MRLFRQQEDFDNEIRRLADFLDVKLPTEKVNALKKRVSFETMAERGYGRSSFTVSKFKWEHCDAAKCPVSTCAHFVLWP